MARTNRKVDPTRTGKQEYGKPYNRNDQMYRGYARGQSLDPKGEQVEDLTITPTDMKTSRGYKENPSVSEKAFSNKQPSSRRKEYKRSSSSPTQGGGF